mgnify:CR=1 FL=1
MTAAPAVAAAMLLAAALLSPERPSRRRWRELTTATATAAEPPPRLRPVWLVVGIGAVGAVGWTLGGAAAGLVVTGLAGAAAVGLRRGLLGRGGERTEDGPELAGCWELLAPCLEAGLRAAGAVLATAEPLTGAAGKGMRRVAGLLELGADPVDAWRTVEHRQSLAAFARPAASGLRGRAKRLVFFEVQGLMHGNA